MNTINFNPQALRAAAMAMAVRDVRYYLNGVLFKVRKDADGTRALLVVGCDGHRMHAVRDDEATGDLENVPTDGIIVADKSVKEILKAAGRKGDWAHLVFDTEAKKYEAVVNGMRFDVEVHDARFPDVGAIVPHESQLGKGTPPQVNAKYIAEAAEAAEILQRGAMFGAIRQTWSPASAWVILAKSKITKSRFTAVIMGLRAEHDDLPLSIAHSCV